MAAAAVDVDVGTHTGPWLLPTDADGYVQTPAQEVTRKSYLVRDCDTALHECMLDSSCSRAFGNVRAMCYQVPGVDIPCSDSCREASSILLHTRKGLDYAHCDCGNTPACLFKRQELYKCTNPQDL